MPIRNPTEPLIRDEGIDKGRPDVIDFVGAGVTASVTAGVATITVPGGSGATSGTAVLDFSGTPGSEAAVAVTGQTSIIAGSTVNAWIRPVATNATPATISTTQLAIGSGAFSGIGTITPTAGRMYIVAITRGTVPAGAALPIGLTGLGILWTKLVQYDDVIGGWPNDFVAALFYGIASDTSIASPLTISNATLSGSWIVLEVVGADTVVQTVSSSLPFGGSTDYNSLPMTLGAFASASNGAISMILGGDTQVSAETPAAGMTALTQENTTTAKRAAWKATSQTAQTWTFSFSGIAGSQRKIGFSLEARAAVVDHSADEHLIENLKITAGNIVAGTGFTIYGETTLGTTLGSFTVNWQWV